MVRGRNALNTILLQIFAFLTPVGFKLVDLIRKDEAISLDYIFLFMLFFVCYVVVVFIRESLPIPAMDVTQIERSQLDKIKEIAQKEVEKRIDEL